MLVMLTGFGLSAAAHNNDSIISDFDALVKIIEDTHPDPYSNYGGRVFFHKKANEFRNSLLNDTSVTALVLYDRAAGFISQLQDGHSYINRPSSNSVSGVADSLLLVKFMYGGGYLFVNAIDSEHCDLLGSRLVAVNDVPVETIAERVAKYYPCENTAAKYGFLSDYFRPSDIYRKLIELPGVEIKLQLLTPDGRPVTYSPSYVNSADFGSVKLARTPDNPKFPSKQMEWREVDGKMFFSLMTVQSRENFDFQYKNGWNFYQQLQYYYRMTGKEMPTDTLAAIEVLPSMSETFLDMLREMKSKGIKDLVIDLRGNGGGWTPITLPTLYMMYGDKYLEKDMSNQFYCRISGLYLKKINCSIDDFNSRNGVVLKVGDYLIPEEIEDSRPIRQKREDFINSAFCSDEIKEELRKMDGNPVYRPERVYVVTDNVTFSAAFHYAFYLSKMGAVVAGETSSQAPNCYMEETPFTLPNTGLTGSISNSLQMFLPSADARSKEFTPDIKLTFDDYRRYDFDRNGILLHLLEK